MCRVIESKIRENDITMNSPVKTIKHNALNASAQHGPTRAQALPSPDRVKASMAAISPGSRIVHYDELIVGAQNSYSEYLERSKTLVRLGSIVDRL